MPAILLLILQGIEATISHAPEIADIAIKAKDFFTSLFTAKLITKEQQDALHARVDATVAAAKAGIIDPAWKVEADPQ